MSKSVETIIVGGGQSGLALSYYLKQQDHEHIILDKAEKVADRWRNHVWDSFTFVTPNWMIRLPGAEYNGNHPDGFMSRQEILGYFQDYVDRFHMPVLHGVEVTSVEPRGDGYLVRSNGISYESANVVVATSSLQVPRIPNFSEKLPAAVDQFHSSQYRNPESLQQGAVLVVGSAQSGAQIAEELYLSGRQVFLSVGRTGRVPRFYRGKDTTKWLEEVGLFDQTVNMLPAPEAKFAGSIQASGARGGRTLNLHKYAQDGVQLLGHLEGVDGGIISVTPDLHENLAATDKFEADMLDRIDGYIAQTGQDAPAEERSGLRDGYDADLLTELDLKGSGISTIIWATGYKHDYNFVKAPIFDPTGYPIQKRGVSEYPGLYFLGLVFLHTLKSSLLYGVGQDAEYLAAHIVAR